MRSDAAQSEVRAAIVSTLALVTAEKSRAGAHKRALLEKLESELSIWQSKLGILLKEPAGRQGMAKHAQYWIKKASD